MSGPSCLTELPSKTIRSRALRDCEEIAVARAFPPSLKLRRTAEALAEAGQARVGAPERAALRKIRFLHSLLRASPWRAKRTPCTHVACVAGRGEEARRRGPRRVHDRRSAATKGRPRTDDPSLRN